AALSSAPRSSDGGSGYVTGSTKRPSMRSPWLKIDSTLPLRTSSLNTVYGTVNASSGAGKNSRTSRKLSARITTNHSHALRGGICGLSASLRSPGPCGRRSGGFDCSVQRLNAALRSTSPEGGKQEAYRQRRRRIPVLASALGHRSEERRVGKECRPSGEA